METNQKILLDKIQFQDGKLNQIETELKELKLDKKNTVKSILNLMLKLTKELVNIEEYSKMNKKGRLIVAYNKLDLELNSKTSSSIIKSVFIYLSSNSSLNFNDAGLSASRFIKGMMLVDNPANNINKFKSNDDLIKALKDIEDKKIIDKAKKIEISK